MIDGNSRWYCARAKPRREHLAIDGLKRQGFTTYFPQLEVEKIRNKRVVVEPEALFPSYVLVAMELTHAAWRAVNGTRGIIKLIGQGDEGRPIPLPRGEIEALQLREKLGQLRISRVRRLKRGDRVKVINGPLAGQTGIVQWSKSERVTFLLSLLGRNMRIVAPSHTLLRVP